MGKSIAELSGLVPQQGITNNGGGIMHAKAELHLVNCEAMFEKYWSKWKTSAYNSFELALAESDKHCDEILLAIENEQHLTKK